MKKLTLLSAALASSLGLVACGNPVSSIAAANSESPAVASGSVATVNGKAITNKSLEFLRQEITQRRGQAAPDDKLVEELVSRELLSQEAESQKLNSRPDIAAKLDYSTRYTLAQIAAEEFMKKSAVTDADLKAEYDARVATMDTTEYKARHILVEKEEKAKEIIAKLKKAKNAKELGAKFAEIAKQQSKDPGSGKEGGDLGWFSPQRMVPPFAEAVKALNDGELTQAPVKTDFGWHVILREEHRKQEAPPFDSVKEQIRQMMQSKRLIDHIAELKGKAKIVMPEHKDATPKNSELKDGSLESTNPNSSKGAGEAK